MELNTIEVEVDSDHSYVRTSTSGEPVLLAVESGGSVVYLDAPSLEPSELISSPSTSELLPGKQQFLVRDGRLFTPTSVLVQTWDCLLGIGSPRLCFKIKHTLSMTTKPEGFKI